MTTRSQISLVLISVLYAFTVSATADPYWVAWEGNDFPENEGWDRWNHDPNWVADRSIADGIMTLDGMSSIEITDGYRIQRSVDPAPGEQFVAQWRLRVNEVGNPIWPYDPGWTLRSDDGWHVAFVIGVDELHSILEHQYIGFEPMEFHEWEFRSSDMRSYTLYLDGMVVQTGTFTYSGVLVSRVSWGDIVYGSNSNSDWDYFRFGVVPEPATIGLFLAGLLACALRTARTSMRRGVLLAVLACVLSAPATAEPYWVAWEGNDFPENEGWERIVNGPQPAERTLADGIMTMDGLADTQIDDYYRMDRPLDPEPGEEFVMQWRLRVDEVIGSPLTRYDPGIGVSSDEDRQLLLVFGVDFIRSFHEDVILSFEPQVFHAFEVRSSDMQSYELRMDGTTVHVGSFWEPSFQQSRIEWGDATRGAASLADWDYFRFGVVPEPWTCTSLLALLCAAHTRRRIQ